MTAVRSPIVCQRSPGRSGKSIVAPRELMRCLMVTSVNLLIFAEGADDLSLNPLGPNFQESLTGTSSRN